MEQDQYAARLKELFDGFDTTGTGSLGQEELTDLCHMFHLEDVAPSLQQALLQDNPHSRINFEQFKEALIDVLSSTLSNIDTCPEPAADCSLEAEPKYIKDGKRYGRRSIPELQDSLEEFDEQTIIEPEEGTRSSQVSSRNCEEILKNVGEEYEAEGQLQFWNPDDLNSSQTIQSPDHDWVKEKLHLIYEDLGITRDEQLHRKKLISICEQYGFQNLDKEALEEALENDDYEETMSLQDFFYKAFKNTKPATQSFSTPYRQLKRHLSLQPYDECGRRTLTPSAMCGTFGLRLFTKFDDGTGYGFVEDIIDMWREEGLDNSHAILEALDFRSEGKINLSELTMTLENELLITKNEIYQAALISFRSEILNLLERVDQTAREKEKLRLDLEKNEKQKNLMALEVDDHHAAIERRNEYNLRKLDEEYKERTAALKCEQSKEQERIFQQHNHLRMEMEQELEKVRVEENYLRDRLTRSLKENTRMESELLETTEKLGECEALTTKLQRSLDNIMREKFGDLDPSYVEFFSHEEKLLQLRNEYERQRRELQDRIDELQLELEDYHAQGLRGFRPSLKNSLFDELDNKNSVDCDQGIGSEDCPPLNMSIEAEIAIENIREQHQREVDKLTTELEDKTTHYEEKLKEANQVFEKEQAIKEKLNNEILKAEAQVKNFTMKHLELEADIQRLKKEHQEAEVKHQKQVNRMEMEFNHQKQQLIEEETLLKLQLDKTRQMYQKEKEELVQRADKMEKDSETKLVKLITTYEDKITKLEQKFEEQIRHSQETHDLEKQKIRWELSEQHQQETEKHRKEMETECNRGILEKKNQCAQVLQLKEKAYKENLVNLENQFQNDLQELLNQHSEERTKWAFEKEELVQEHIEKQEKCMENTQQEKSVLENSYKELINNLSSEKEQIEKELDKLNIRVLQLESDLWEKLTERDKHLGQAEKNVLRFQNIIAELEKQHKYEKECISEMSVSSIIHQDVIKEAKVKELEMLEEKNRLQNIIIDLKAEVTSLSVIQGEYELVWNENMELKNEVSQHRNNVLLKDKTFNLQKEQTVKEKAELMSKVADLQKKLDLAENDLIQINEKRELDGKVEFTQAVKSLETKLLEKHEQLCHANNYIKNLQDTLENLKKQYEFEKDELNSKLSTADELYREQCMRMEEKRLEMMKEITDLQNTIDELKNETTSMSRIKRELKLKEKENSEFKNVLSQLHLHLTSLEEVRGGYRNLQDVHEQMVEGNIVLRSEISKLDRNLHLTNTEINKEAVQTENNPSLHLSKIKLKDTYEELGHTMINVQLLNATEEKMEKDPTDEKQILQDKLSKLEVCYKELYVCTNAKKQEMLLEINRLQMTISDLQNEISSFAKTHQDSILAPKEIEEISKRKQLHVNKMTGHDTFEKTKQEHQVEEHVQLLGETLQTVKLEGESFRPKQLQSKELEKKSEVENGKEEITRLTDTIKELEDKIASLFKIQDELALLQKENSELKHSVIELQNSSVVFDKEEVFKNLQTAHEQTVKENVRLLTEVSKFQKKFSMLENKTFAGKITNYLEKTNIEYNQTAKLQPDRNVDVTFIDYNEMLDAVNTKRLNKTKELEDTTKVLCQLEQGYNHIKAENDHLKTNVISTQDQLNCLTLEYDQFKKAISLEEIKLPELGDAPITIPGLKYLLAVAKLENVHLKDSLKVIELRNVEAIENNRTLSSEVSCLQNEIQNMERITEASLKLENLFDETKKENEELKSLIHIMQEKMCVLDKPFLKPLLRNKSIQTGLDAEKREQNLKINQGKMSSTSSLLQTKLANNHLMSNGLEYDKIAHSKVRLLSVTKKEESLENLEHSNKTMHYEIAEDIPLVGDVQELELCHLSLSEEIKKLEERSAVERKMSENHKMMEHLRAENMVLQERISTLGGQITALKDEKKSSNQKLSELLNACEEMWVNLEAIQNEKITLEKMVTELKSRNEQLVSENEELFLKNLKNQENLQELNSRLLMFLKQKDHKDSSKGLEEWQKEKCQMKEEIESCRSKILNSEQEVSQLKVHNCFLEQENTLLRQEIETKELAKCSEVTDLKNENSLLRNKHEKLLKEVEAQVEEHSNCVSKSAKVGYIENKITSLKQEQKTGEQQINSLRSQLAMSQEKMQNLEVSLQNSNLQMSRIKSDLRVAQQEKESLKQEVMALHKQLQNANAKKQVLEMAIHSSGLQNQQKKHYWDDLEQLIEQEQQLLRQENERLQGEVQNTKTDLAQSREKVRQLESTVISLKHQKQGNQSSLVKALEQEKSSLRRECDQLHLELTTANRKISQLSSLEEEMEKLQMKNEGLWTKQAKYDDHLMEKLHSPTNLSHSHSLFHQQVCATVPRDQYLQLQQQLQQAERSNQQLQAALDNHSTEGNPRQDNQETLLRKMEARMIDVEQKLRIVKLLLQEKVNQLKEQVTRNSMNDATIKDLYVENSQLLKALEMSKQRQQTTEQKSYLLEKKIFGLNKMVRGLTPSSQ